MGRDRPEKLIMAYEAFGVRFAVRLGDAEPLRYAHNYLPFGSLCLPHEPTTDHVRFALRRTPDSRSWRAFKGRSRICETRSLRFAMERFHEALLRHISSHAPSFTFVHAGAVAWRGRALIIPGNSFSGKSTLVRRLVEAGATYYSDDLAVIDGKGRLHPYARVLQFRAPGTFQQCPIPLSDLTGETCRSALEPVPVTMVAFSNFDKKAPWARQELSLGNIAMEGLRHTLTFRSSPERHLRTWATVAGAAAGFRWRRGEATEAAARLLRALESGCLPE